jgi:CHAT domain-containing protein
VAPQLINLGPARRIEGAVAAWRWSYLTGTTADTSGLIALAAECSVAGRRLAALIWDPLALDNATGTIYLVPDGALDLVDFLALPRAAGGFVVENEAVLTLVSAERDLVGGEARAQGPAGLLVMGGMDFGPAAHQPAAAGDCRNYQDLSFSPLPGTLREATAVADLWTALGGGPVQRLVGPAAREGSFKSQAGASRVAHLATHGFFLGGDCRAATPGTRGVGTLQPDPARKLSADPVNPLLLAGLAFSGANREERQDGEDGILTAYEVASLDLSGVELAVLSACDTGQGRVLAGEGVFGLQRAFALAGVRGVIMSLWPVDDELATAWMEQLYRHHLRDGMAYPLAVREASRAMLLARRARGLPEHPCRWSPFIGIRTGS